LRLHRGLRLKQARSQDAGFASGLEQRTSRRAVPGFLLSANRRTADGADAIEGLAQSLLGSGPSCNGGGLNA